MPQEIDFARLSDELRKYQPEILRLWIGQVFESAKKMVAAAGEEQIKRSAGQIIDAVFRALPDGANTAGPGWGDVRKTVDLLAGELAAKDVSPGDTAMFIMSMKDAYLTTLQNFYDNKDQLADVVLELNRILDRVGILTFETFGRKREALIKEQQKALLELSTPIVKVWDRILLVPLIGVLDSQRTQMVMENLLGGIEETQSKVAILDISGIPIVDSLVAKHLIRTVAAAKLMGAQCIITGIRARISQTMIQLGVDLTDVVTRSTLADGLRVALDILNLKIVPRS